MNENQEEILRLLLSARRRLAVLYIAGIGGELVRLDLRLALDELDEILRLGRVNA